jgi:nucleoside 2-deoxyribosyltransferase
MKKILYLAGYISTKAPLTIEWRIEAEHKLRDKFEVLSPLRHKMDLSTSTDGGMTVATRTSKDIIFRDYSDIMTSDIVLFHLENFGESRPLIGTLMELAWCWQLKKPTVGICYKDNAIYYNHPFIVEAIGHYFLTENEAIDFLNNYWC